MKSLILALALTLSTSAFARQYIQCSVVGNSTDVAVVNLQNAEGGTLFLSSGMQNPEDERILVNIEFDKMDKDHHIFKVVNENGEGFVAVPSIVIGKYSDYFQISLSFAGHFFNYSCFSSIYND